MKLETQSSLGSAQPGQVDESQEALMREIEINKMYVSRMLDKDA